MLVAGVGRVVVGRVLVAEVAVRDAGVVPVVNRPTGLVVEVAVRKVGVALATLDRRSAGVGLKGARLEAVPAIDIRFAVPEMPRFSSPELATERDFSSAELLTDILDRWDKVVEVRNGSRAAVVGAGRVGGLFKVLLLLVLGREVGFDADDEVGRLVAAVPDTGRFTASRAPELALVDEDLGTSLTASGLDWATSSPPERTGSTGVAGG